MDILKIKPGHLVDVAAVNDSGVCLGVATGTVIAVDTDAQEIEIVWGDGEVASETWTLSRLCKFDMVRIRENR